MSRFFTWTSTIRSRAKAMLVGLSIWFVGATALWFSLPYQPRFVLPGTENSVVASFSPNGRILATKTFMPKNWNPKTKTIQIGENGPVRLWDLNSGEEMASFSTNERFAERIEFTPDSTTIVIDCISTDGTERVLSIIAIKTKEELANISAEPETNMTHLAADGKTLVFYPPGDEHAKIWDISLGRERLISDSCPVCFSPDGLWFATMQSDSKIQIKKSGSEEIIRTIALESKNRSLKAFAVSPDGSMLICDAYTGVKVWDPATGGELASVDRATNPKFSRSGKRLAARCPGVGGWTFTLWNPTSGLESGELIFPPAEWQWKGDILAGPGPEDFCAAATRTRGTVSGLSELLPNWMTRFLGIRSSMSFKTLNELRLFDIASGKELADYSTEGEIHLAPDASTFAVDSGSSFLAAIQAKESRNCIMVFDIPLRRPLAHIAFWPLPFAFVAMMVIFWFIAKRKSREKMEKSELEATT